LTPEPAGEDRYVSGVRGNKVQSFLYVILFSVMLLAGAIVLSSAGWFFFLLGIFIFPVVLVVHGLIHVLAIRKRPWIPAIVVSHLLFLGAFLFRVDSGDASSFVAVDAIAWRLGMDFHTPAWMAGAFGAFADLFLFILVAVSWLYVFPFRNPQLAGRILVAVLLPWWHFYLIGRPVAALLSFGFVLTITGWVPAAIWALSVLIGSEMDEEAVRSKAAS